jgi:DNA-binding MarR family transcriptional regulator
MSDKPELLDHLGWHLWRCAQQWTEAFVEEMRQRGYTDFSLARASVLPYLKRNGTSRASDVVAASGMTKQAVNQTLDELTKAGLIRRTTDPADGRAKRIEFTPRGKAFIEDGNVAKQAIESRWLDRLTPDQRQHLVAGLIRLAPVPEQ